MSEELVAAFVMNLAELDRVVSQLLVVRQRQIQWSLETKPLELEQAGIQQETFTRKLTQLTKDNEKLCADLANTKGSKNPPSLVEAVNLLENSIVTAAWESTSKKLRQLYEENNQYQQFMKESSKRAMEQAEFYSLAFPRSAGESKKRHALV